ncbi:Retrovirus-related Pol polyprotein from transposon TNT 1-94 [Sesamum angolense]|uniref:Retrovirus-related Pol polyprotein from transposon TNT 1-94 n=1 Tax=Sesamum angolense TaxID=2727404 RepID=A0AAE1W040_9LAMI|nr:Retrovirus-related Pol polyprotein from transposon TNT 1-94 [Sesamum angolense]
MNGLEKSNLELINMLVQYEATTYKSAPVIPKIKGARGPDAGRGRREGEKSLQPLLVPRAPLLLPVERAKGKERFEVLSGRRQMMSACIAKERGIGRGSAHGSSPTQVLDRSRKLCKDEMILRLGDGKAVVAEAVGSLNTPPGTPQMNGVAERRNQTLLDMVRSMMSFTKLLLSFWCYALETAGKLINMAPSKAVPQTPYETWHGKPASYKYLRVWGNPVYVKRLMGDKLDSRSNLCRFIEYPKETVGYYFNDIFEKKIFVLRNTVFLKKGFPADSRQDKARGERIHSTTQGRFWGNLLASGHGQVHSDTTSHAAWYDYDIWQMDVKMAFLNDYIEEDLYGSTGGFHFCWRRTKGLSSPKGYNFIKNEHDPSVYKKISGSSVAYLVLYVDDILLIDIRHASRRRTGARSRPYATTADPTTEAEYIADSEVAKEAVWMKNYIQELGMLPSIVEPMVIFCDNNMAIAQVKEPRSHHRSKHILMLPSA